MILGTVLSYFFQWYNILSKKSAEGLSFVMLFVGIASSFTTVCNQFVLEFRRFICCSITSASACMLSLLGFFQVSAVFCSFFPVYILYLYFSPLKKEYPRRHLVAIILFVVLILFCAAIALTSLMLLRNSGMDSPTVRGFGYGLGILTMVATICQWMPQIIQTLITKNPGQLSIIMLAIQGPGNAANAFFLGFSEQSSVTSYLPFAMSSAQQCFLLVVCLVLRCRTHFEQKRQKQLREPDKQPGALPFVTDAQTISDSGADDTQVIQIDSSPDERTPLVRGTAVGSTPGPLAGLFGSARSGGKFHSRGSAYSRDPVGTAEGTSL